VHACYNHSSCGLSKATATTEVPATKPDLKEKGPLESKSKISFFSPPSRAAAK